MKFYIVDCFAEQKYQGNQLLVVVADKGLSDDEQQNIAREINFSETSFILSGKNPDGGYDVRIWTPNVGEVTFAGHPTLGTAYIINRYLDPGKSDIVKLNLKVGQIPVICNEDGLTMRQNSPVFGTEIPKEEIAEVFGIKPDEISSEFPVQLVSTGLEAVLIPLRHREDLSRVKTDKERFNEYIIRHPECNCNHLFFVQTGERELSARCLMEDFVEDPATGSANGDLAAYLLKHDFFKTSDISYSVIQGEDMGRRSVLYVNASLSDNEWRIEVGGRCRIIATGDWAQ